MKRYAAIATLCLSCFFLSSNNAQAQDLFGALGDIVTAPLALFDDSSDDGESGLLGGALDWTRPAVENAAELPEQAFDLFWRYHYAPVLAREFGLLEE